VSAVPDWQAGSLQRRSRDRLEGCPPQGAYSNAKKVRD
jgi:hypothetical protein